MATAAAFSWKNRLVDVGGYANPTAAVGTPEFVAGKFDRGLACFDGNGMTITYPSGSYYWDLSGGKSFGLWVKANPGPAGQTRVLYDLGANRLHLAGPDGNVGILVENSYFSSGVNVCDGTWHHILYTWDRVTFPGATMRLWVDGVQVATTTRSTSPYSDSGIGYIGRSATGEPANAVLSDMRIWNDPVFTNEATYLRDLPVTDYQQGLWSFDRQSGGSTHDASEHGRHLPMGGNAQLVAGQTNNALTSISGASPALTAAFTPAPLDRITWMFWLRVPTLSAVTDILRVSDASQTRHEFTHQGSGQLRAFGRRDDGTTATATSATGVISAGTWYRVVVQSWYVGTRILINGTEVAYGAVSGGSTSNPINLPSFSNLATLRIGAGVEIDDFRFVSNWVTGEALTRLPATALPAAERTGVLRGDGTPIRVRRLLTGGLVDVTVSPFATGEDTDPPEVPTGVASSAITTSGFTVSWTASPDAGEVPDTTAPTVPTDVDASDITSSGFNVSWEGSTDA